MAPVGSTSNETLIIGPGPSEDAVDHIGTTLTTQQPSLTLRPAHENVYIPYWMENGGSRCLDKPTCLPIRLHLLPR